MTEKERRSRLDQLFGSHWLYRFRDGGSTRCMLWGENVPSKRINMWLPIIKSGDYFFAKQDEQSDIEFYNLRKIKSSYLDLSLKIAEGLKEKHVEDTNNFYNELEEIYEDLQKDSTNK